MRCQGVYAVMGKYGCSHFINMPGEERALNNKQIIYADDVLNYIMNILSYRNILVHFCGTHNLVPHLCCNNL